MTSSSYPRRFFRPGAVLCARLWMEVPTNEPGKLGIIWCGLLPQEMTIQGRGQQRAAPHRV